MNNCEQKILLEFERDTIYKPSEIVSKLLSLFPDLGNEVILPIDMISENNAEIPILFFQQNDLFKISANFHNIQIIVNGKYTDDVESIVKKVFEIFKELKINFVGMSYTFEQEQDKGKIDLLKEKYLKISEEENLNEIFLSFIRYLEINGFDIRWLEGYSTMNSTFLRHFEFNTKVTAITKINYRIFVNLYKKFNKIIDDNDL